MGDLLSLGRNVHRLRAERHMSLGLLAAEAGLAKQTLANVENGSGNPTVETLFAISRALGVRPTWLLAEWGSPVLVQRRRDAEWASGVGERRRALDQIYGSGHVATTLLEVSPRAPERAPLSPGTLHHLYVIDGEVIAGPTTDGSTLGSGDFVRFPGDVPHVIRGRHRRALVHLVTTMPQPQQFSGDDGLPAPIIARPS